MFKINLKDEFEIYLLNLFIGVVRVKYIVLFKIKIFDKMQNLSKIFLY